MNITIHFKNQRGLSKTPCDLYGVTIEIHDESLNDLLPPKMDSRLIRRRRSPKGAILATRFAVFSVGVISRRKPSVFVRAKRP